ncbi:MAG: hypothetical protein WAU12_00940 [Saprospiraceae bacterium]|jgi:hypothetical protein|nr:hypothetical protein [Candidatus Brachybacter algidus]
MKRKRMVTRAVKQQVAHLKISFTKDGDGGDGYVGCLYYSAFKSAGN